MCANKVVYGRLPLKVAGGLETFISKGPREAPIGSDYTAGG